MLIDWFTIVAQIINFLVLVVLLRRFLYGPIIRAMDQREGRIAAQMEEAEEKAKAAEQEAESYRQRARELEDRRREMLDQIKVEAEDHRRELAERARSEVQESQLRWYGEIQREKDLFLRDLQARTSEQVWATARRALADLAGADLEHRVIEVFVQRLRQLDEDEWQAIAESTQKSRGGIAISSAFEIPQEMRREIVGVVQDRIAGGLNVRFGAAPDLVLGIELKAPGRKVSWSVKEYLETLEESLSQALAEETVRGNDGELNEALSE